MSNDGFMRACERATADAQAAQRRDDERLSRGLYAIDEAPSDVQGLEAYIPLPSGALASFETARWKPAEPINLARAPSSTLVLIDDRKRSPLTAQWHEALAPLNIRHPNGRSRVVLRLTDRKPPSLDFRLDANPCTLTGGTREDFAISSVRLTFFPGAQLARAWLACAWAAFLAHEAMELVTIGDLAIKVMDPHAAPYPTNEANRPLRDALPPELTPDNFERALASVMSIDDARAYVELHEERSGPPTAHESDCAIFDKSDGMDNRTVWAECTCPMGNL